jgi:hypothetical protein
LSQAFQTGLVSRPSNVTGKKYQDVSDAYIQAVHSVLTGEKSAQEAAGALEKELVRITGFKTGPPQQASAVEPRREVLNQSIRLASAASGFFRKQ